MLSLRQRDQLPPTPRVSRYFRVLFASESPRRSKTRLSDIFAGDRLRLVAEDGPILVVAMLQASHRLRCYPHVGLKKTL